MHYVGFIYLWFGVHRPVSEVKVRMEREGSREVFVQVRREGTKQRLSAAYRVRDKGVRAKGVLDTCEWSEIGKGSRRISTSHIIKVK